jgi:hypothetical protein
MLHLFSQPRAAGFLTGQQEFSAANPRFFAKRMDCVTHFPALEIPDATAAETELFAG